MRWITATEINDWTDREPRRAQETVPLLIWKLILASCTQINDHHFPYGKSIQYSGYDGGLDTDESSPFYPSGKSVWEIGTDENSHGKFNSDYQKRTNDPKGIIMSETTFCFVTSRIWNHKLGITEITAQKNAEGKWKGVRIIDANTLELWLDTCPAVSAWFSGIIGKPSEGVQELGEYWRNTVENTSPQLTAEFFTYHRESIATQLVTQIKAGARQVVLVGSSALEGYLTLAAELSVADDLSLHELAARCLIVSSQAAFDEVNTQCGDTIIIPTFHPTSSTIEKRKNVILLPVSKFDPLDLMNKTGNRIEIPPRSRHEFCDSLEKLGYEANAAYDLGKDLRCSFPALFRKITTDAVIKIPEWSRNENSEVLVPALFAGAWEENHSGDKEVVGTMAAMPYDDYMASLRRYVTGENAPIFSIDHSYACIAVSDMWDLLWSRITPEIFTRFKECFLTVFSESDPAYDLPENQWFMADVLGNRSVYSKQLKESLIVSLIMLTEREESTRGSTFNSHISEECSALVRQVFHSTNTLELWRTLSPYIPAFIEAAPDVVLHTLEEAAIKPESLMWELFKPADDVLFGRTFYTYILWALEKMMWNRRYATRALRLLICFSEKHFDFKLSNSPDRTLYHIFCLWHPQGVFTYEERKVLIKDIIENHHTIAPTLVSALLSGHQQTTSPISHPRWKIVENTSGTITVAEYTNMRTFTAQVYLEQITPCIDDWNVVFSNLSSFSPIQPVIEKCQTHVPNMLEQDRLELCKKLSQYISQSRKFSRNNEEEVNAVEQLYFSILPDIPQSYAHYFSYHFDGLTPQPYENGKYDFDAERQRKKAFQTEKVQEMVARYGINSIQEIASLVEDTYSFATVIAEGFLERFDWGYIASLRQINLYIAAHIVSILYQKHGLSMIEAEKSNLSPSDLGWVLSCPPISPEIAAYVDSIGNAECRRVYWEQVRIFGEDSSDNNWVERCVQTLLEYHRPYTVIDWLSYSDWNETTLILEILHKALQQYPKAEPKGLTLEQVGYNDIERMFLKLYANADVPELDAARLELAYIQIFDLDFEPKYLIDQVLHYPELYMELLASAYYPDEGKMTSTSIRMKYAEQSRTALDRIHRIPGFDKTSGQMNEYIFDKWVANVTELARSSGYTQASDIVLGTILSYAPTGSDGIWPTECVRRLFERPHSDILENHFIIGLENQRGVHDVTGGASEDALAEKYYAYAENLQLLYPCTASIIHRISDNYRTVAKSERARELKGYY